MYKRLGNHDLTLSPTFMSSPASERFKWPSPQDPALCRQLLLASPSITYLEHEAATVYLPRRKTALRIFGSPYTPGRRGWAFQYWGNDEAEKIWGEEGMEGVDVLVTHGPGYGNVDETEDGERAGCNVLARRVKETRPMLHVCGHIHAGRGVERVIWGDDGEEDGIDKAWVDSGLGNKKLSLLDLTGKTGRKIEHRGRTEREHVVDGKLKDLFESQPAAEPHRVEGREQAPSLVNSALNEAEVGMHVWRRKAGGAIECRRRSGVGRSEVDADGLEIGKALEGRNETVMINAAFLGPRASNNKAYTFNKPIVVDVELPVYEFEGDS